MRGTGQKRLEMMNMQMKIRYNGKAFHSMLLVLSKRTPPLLVQQTSVESKLDLTTYRCRHLQWSHLTGLWWHLRLWLMSLQVSATLSSSWRVDLMIKSMTLFWDCRTNNLLSLGLMATAWTEWCWVQGLEDVMSDCWFQSLVNISMWFCRHNVMRHYNNSFPCCTDFQSPNASYLNMGTSAGRVGQTDQKA